eukprot:scaffold481603_cov31-Prasinocladus_malaysianus.AAC.1
MWPPLCKIRRVYPSSLSEGRKFFPCRTFKPQYRRILATRGPCALDAGSGYRPTKIFDRRHTCICFQALLIVGPILKCGASIDPAWRVLVAGADGRTGIEVVRALRKRGIVVLAGVRNLKNDHDDLRKEGATSVYLDVTRYAEPKQDIAC